jgi:hypothetical protein
MFDLLNEHIQPTDKEGHQYLKVGKTSAELMLSLVYDILDYSQIKAGKFQPNFSVF